MDTNLLYPDGYQGVDLFTFAANLAQRPHHQAHPGPRGILGAYKRCAVSGVDLPVHSGRWSLD